VDVPRPHRPELTTHHDDLERLVVIAATFREADTPSRERLAERLAAPDPVFAEQLDLHTCHRVEKIGLLADGQAPASPPGAGHHAGMDAAEHVFLVAGGLDSAVIGEEQILGQVRDAFRVAQESGAAGPILGELLRRAIRFARRVRSEAQPAGDTSLADRAGQWLENRAATPLTDALVIGTGEMGRLIATGLASRGVSVAVASRHLGRAERLARSLPGPGPHHAIALSDIERSPRAFDVIVIALRGGTTPIGRRHIAALRPALVVDLSAPRTITPDAASELGDRLLDLDGLGFVAGPSLLTPTAERRFRREARLEAERFGRWLELRANGDGIALLREHADEVRRRHLARVAARAALSPEQAEAVDAMTQSLIGELLHVPTVQLGQGTDAAMRVREVFGID
jgi:glutamyl-tRNA reductase